MDPRKTELPKEGDVLRIEYGKAVSESEEAAIVYVDSVEQKNESITIGLADKWGDPETIGLAVHADGKTDIVGNVWMEAQDIRMEVVGSVPPDFGEYLIQFRPLPYRDHILQESLDGRYRTVCSYNVDIHSGDKRPIKEITSRQCSLLDVCDRCAQYLRQNLSNALPEPKLCEEIEKESPFLCPSCGEETERVRYSKRLQGVLSHHQDKQCGPWSRSRYLKWRVDG